MEHTEHITEQESLIHDRGAEMRNGGSWFFWLAALSIINSLILFFAPAISHWFWLIGLGVNRLVENVFASQDFRPAALIVNLAIAGALIGFGYYARRGVAGAFILGIFLYIVDGLLCLIYGGYLAVAFHVFALFFIVKGLIGNRRLNQGED